MARENEVLYLPPSTTSWLEQRQLVAFHVRANGNVDMLFDTCSERMRPVSSREMADIVMRPDAFSMPMNITQNAPNMMFYLVRDVEMPGFYRKLQFEDHRAGQEREIYHREATDLGYVPMNEVLSQPEFKLWYTLLLRKMFWIHDQIPALRRASQIADSISAVYQALKGTCELNEISGDEIEQVMGEAMKRLLVEMVLDQ